MTKHPTPTAEGYWWAQWRIASAGTIDGDELTPSDTWEIVQVVDNNGESGSREEYSVHIPGVQQTQWLDQFVWGPRVCGLTYTPPAPLKFHNYTVADVLVPGDPANTSRALRKLRNEKLEAGLHLRLLLSPEDLDEQGRVRHTQLFMFYSAVVAVRHAGGWQVKKYVCPLDEALVGLDP